MLHTITRRTITPAYAKVMDTAQPRKAVLPDAPFRTATAELR